MDSKKSSKTFILELKRKSLRQGSNKSQEETGRERWRKERRRSRCLSYINMEVIHRPDKPRSGRGSSEKEDCWKPKVPVEVYSGSAKHQQEKKKKTCCSSQNPQFDLSTQVRWSTRTPAPGNPTLFSCLHGRVHT